MSPRPLVVRMCSIAGNVTDDFFFSSTVEATVMDNSDGSYSVSYTPEEPGAYSVWVCVRAQHVKVRNHLVEFLTPGGTSAQALQPSSLSCSTSCTLLPVLSSYLHIDASCRSCTTQQCEPRWLLVCLNRVHLSLIECWLAGDCFLSLPAGLSVHAECKEEVEASRRDVSLLLLLFQRRSQRGSLWLPRNHAR